MTCTRLFAGDVYREGISRHAGAIMQMTRIAKQTHRDPVPPSLLWGWPPLSMRRQRDHSVLRRLPLQRVALLANRRRR